MIRILVCLYFFNSVAGFAQDKEKKNAPLTIRGSIGIPASTTSRMFKTAFEGVYEGNLSVNVRLFSNFHAGLGYQNSHFQNNKDVFVYYKVPTGLKSSGASLAYNTRIMAHSGFLKLGYDRFFSSIGYMNYALNTGFMMANYTNVVLDTSAVNRPFVSQSFSTPYLQPEISVNFKAEELLSFSLFMSYTTLFYTFDPKAPRFNGFEEVRRRSNRFPISWLSFGFGFNVLINGKK